MMLLMTTAAIAVAMVIALLIRLRDVYDRAELANRKDRLSGFGASFVLHYQRNASVADE